MLWKTVAAGCVLLFTVIACPRTSVGWETSAKSAYQIAQSMDQPMMIVGTSDYCGPCQRLKAILAEDENIKAALQHVVLLVIDTADPEFRKIVDRYGVPVSMVPMVYLVDAQDALVFAQPGLLEAAQIQSLLASVTPHDAAERTDESFRLEARLAEIRKNAKDGDLITALQMVTPISQLSSDTKPVLTARNYEQQLLSAISDWLVELDGRMAINDQKYEAAYNLVKIYVNTPEKHQHLRKHAADLATFYANHEPTRIAVQQAKQLVQARADEVKQRCEDAIEHYQQVTALDPDTPGANYARQRIPMLRGRQATKLTGAAL